MRKNKAREYNPVTNYMEQYNNAVRYDAQPQQNVQQPAPQPAPQYYAAQPVQPITPTYPVYPAAAPNAAPEVPDQLDGKLETKEATKTFRRLCSRVGVALLLFVVCSLVFGYVIIAIPFLLHLGEALANTDASALFSSGNIGEGISTVVEYVRGIMSEEARNNWNLAASILTTIPSELIAGAYLAKKAGFKTFSCMTKGTRYGKGLFIKGLILSFGGTIVWSLIYNVLSMMLSGTGVEQSQFPISLPSGAVGMALYCFAVVIAAPLFEEFLFRGVILKALTPYGTFFAVMTSAILFGLMHGNLQQTPFAFMIGLVLGYCAIKTGNIWTGALIHFCINGFSTLMEIISAKGSETTLMMASLAALGLYAIGVIGGIIILAKNSKNISFTALPADNNSIVRPVLDEQPIRKYLNCYTAAFMIVFLAYFVFSFISSFGA